MTTPILPTRNQAHGFVDTLQLARADPMQSWIAASAMIAAGDRRLGRGGARLRRLPPRPPLRR